MKAREHRSSGSTWFCLRRNGVVCRDGWLEGVRIEELRACLGARADEVVKVCVTGRFREVLPARFSRAFPARERGLTGVEMALRGSVVRLAPTHMLAANLGFGRALERFLARNDTDAEAFRAGGTLRAFSANQYLLPGRDTG